MCLEKKHKKITYHSIYQIKTVNKYHIYLDHKTYSLITKTEDYIDFQFLIEYEISSNSNLIV